MVIMQGAYTVDDQTITFRPGILNPGQQVSMTIHTDVIAVPDSGTIVNVATAVYDGQELEASARLVVASTLPDTGYPVNSGLPAE